jgi:lysozyme
MIPSKNAFDLIRRFEGCKLESYQDQRGVWTIGWGTTGAGITEGLTISQGMADAMFIGHVKEIGLSITDILGNQTSRLNQNQFDALTSFTYNVGSSAFAKSTLCQYVKQSKYNDAAQEFLKWDHVNGVVIAGLLERRQAEQQLFLQL